MVTDTLLYVSVSHTNGQARGLITKGTAQIAKTLPLKGMCYTLCDNPNVSFYIILFLFHVCTAGLLQEVTEGVTILLCYSK